MRNKLLAFVLLLTLFSCVSTKSTLKNVDDHALILKLNPNNTFAITEYSKDPKYGFDKDYPINVFYKNAKDENINQQRYLNALAGPKGEAITYRKIETCCPFPTKNVEIGVGLLDVYEISWQGQKEPVRLHLNYFERGALMVPVGLTLKR